MIYFIQKGFMSLFGVCLDILIKSQHYSWTD